MDRVIQQAILQILGPMWDPEFSASSFGFRPRRNAHGAVKQVQRQNRDGYRWAVDIDLAKFFDTVDHRKLMGRLARKLQGDPVLKLIARYLRAGVEINDTIEPTTKGVPQGGPLSPLLANIMLDDLDRELEERGHRFARYADDFVIQVRSPRAAERVMRSIACMIEGRLKLRVNHDKSRICRVRELEFLGFTFYNGRIRVSGKSMKLFKQRLKYLTGRHWFVSMEDRLAQLRLFVQGWMGYYGISQIYREWPELDSWLRRRIRLCYWVMWKRPRARIRNLRALGMPIRQAVGLGRSSLGPWKCSRLMGFAMSKNWLESQGLICLADEWWRCAHLR
jgi:RNA-directed DNA polymerase